MFENYIKPFTPNKDFIIFKSEKETFKDVQVKGGLALGIDQNGEIWAICGR